MQGLPVPILARLYRMFFFATSLWVFQVQLAQTTRGSQICGSHAGPSESLHESKTKFTGKSACALLCNVAPCAVRRVPCAVCRVQCAVLCRAVACRLVWCSVV